MPEVKEIVVVCDPSYQDIFEGMQMHINKMDVNTSHLIYFFWFYRFSL